MASLHDFLIRPPSSDQIMVSGDEYGRSLFTLVTPSFIGCPKLTHFRDFDALTLYDKTHFDNTTLVYHDTRSSKHYAETFKHCIWVLVEKVTHCPENFFHVECKWSRKEGTLILAEVLRKFGANSVDSDIRLIGDRLAGFEELLRVINMYKVCPELSPQDIFNVLTLKSPSVEYLFLHRKIEDVIREAQIQPPILFLTSLHKILYKVYCWLEGCKVSEDQTVNILGIKRYELGTWKSLSAVYNPKLIREALEETAECLKQVKSGEKKLWLVKLYNVLTKFGG